MQFEEAKDWRQLLSMIIRDPRIRQRIIDELGIKPITLNRWVEGDTEPRSHNFRQLLSILPEYREYFYGLLGDEYIDAAVASVGDVSQEIPPGFFDRVMVSRANTIKMLRFWTLCNMILQQAIGQLDPDRLGMAITVATCLKSSKHSTVRSLRETVALGTPPWPGNMEQRGMFLGAESLAGYCVTTCRGVQINDIRDRQNPLPAHQVPHELSAATYPIMLSGKIAGCLLISSTQPHFFMAQYRVDLLQIYANLVSIAFEPDQFYDADVIKLRPMPPLVDQEHHFADFRERVLAAMARGKYTNREAEQVVWEEIEEELMKA